MVGAQEKAQRKKVLVDTKMQISVALPVLGMILALSLVHLGTSLFLLGEDNEAPDSLAAHRLSLAVMGAYFGMVLIGAFLTAIVQTHRIAGPAIVIERALRGFTEGDYSRRLSLRDKDHLQSLAAAATALGARLREQESGRRELASQIAAALDDGDLDRLRELHSELASLELGPVLGAEGEEPRRSAA